ncbi:CinA family nicotinamide mononucleotide deamidase-related protein [Ferrimonas sp. SCSIO 43195]|uniref:CinA family nicotinamide mononucleotide deamidase-related protein n=1 Tax=Ferrimonas sp. SCSIO 43195 TaxID=2822844 RepID=UPI002074C5B4|nr:CinA family nicotinamide mononucleotide deamidase-related protein [Ferrimonas sp. SCSIO 43195]USD37877.1 CinA family nicotinamide mononucleotide deamidase-related protein [Ferrimonas sp. SCSIO 43195]
MKIEMICTGEEVLSGQIVDTNAAWVANTLMEQGYELSRKTTVGDRMDDLVAAFRHSAERADLVIVNGGLGPTSDDLSAEAAAQALGEPVVMFEQWRAVMEQMFSARGRVMTPSNLKQAMLPRSAIVVDNPVGTACGFRVRLGKAWLFFTPGVPHELFRMVNEQLLPFLHDLDPQQGGSVSVHKLLTLGQAESAMANDIDALTVPCPEGVTVGYRASMPHIEVKLFRRSAVDLAQWHAYVEAVKVALGDSLVAENQPLLANEIHRLLTEQGATLALAESCTGGMIADQLVTLAGSSAYLQGSLVTYSNEAKQICCGVQASTLQQHGAVSLPTVVEMAEGARARLRSDYGVSVSGIAGPDGGTEDKPVGTVCFCVSGPTGSWSQTLAFGSGANRSRTLIRKLSAAVALDMLRRLLLGQPVIADYPFLKRVDRLPG